MVGHSYALECDSCNGVKREGRTFWGRKKSDIFLFIGLLVWFHMRGEQTQEDSFLHNCSYKFER